MLGTGMIANRDTAIELAYAVRDLQFTYQLGAQKVEALRGVSFDVRRGQFICLTGPSGSGKTTLLSVLGLIEKVQGGEVRFRQRDLAALSEDERNEIRRFRIGFVFQHFHLFPILTAEENIEYFLYRQGLRPADRAHRVRRALEAVHLWEHRKKRPLAMSGGQRQRVAIARALAKEPEVIIADEPTASLDQATGRGILETLTELNRDRGITIVAASHDPMVQGYAKTRIELRDGQISSVGAAAGGVS